MKKISMAFRIAFVGAMILFLIQVNMEDGVPLDNPLIIIALSIMVASFGMLSIIYFLGRKFLGGIILGLSSIGIVIVLALNP